jgi:hypothetical protein
MSWGRVLSPLDCNSQECTFKPRINPDSVAIVEKTYKPIHDRLGDIQASYIPACVRVSSVVLLHLDMLNPHHHLPRGGRYSLPSIQYIWLS